MMRIARKIGKGHHGLGRIKDRPERGSQARVTKRLRKVAGLFLMRVKQEKASSEKSHWEKSPVEKTSEGGSTIDEDRKRRKVIPSGWVPSRSKTRRRKRVNQRSGTVVLEFYQLGLYEAHGK